MDERVIGILSYELLDRVLILNERHLARLLHGYLSYCSGRQRANPDSNGPQASRAALP
ncbi:hypothetical protein ACTMTF_00005 [Nonomuraea sp. ZG12]|uniref:hypothetical protein n=1 Tax=Nonomuraea sp. ZG12 TaxID=3452207 RepID=UPI003F8C8949